MAQAESSTLKTEDGVFDRKPVFGAQSTPSPAFTYSGEELLDASFMSSTSSAVRVEINDVEESLLPSTAAALRRCKSQVLRPYWRLLSFIGWRAFGRESIYYSSGWKCINIVYPIFVVVLLLFAYIYAVIACQGGLNIDDEIKAVTIIPSLTTQNSHQVSINPLYNQTTTVTNMVDVVETVPTSPWSGDTSASLVPHCYHIFTSYIVSDILHFLAFCMGLWIFRVQENEELNALIEHTFLQASPLTTGSITQANMIKSMRLILIFGGIWILSTLGLHGLFLGTFHVYHSTTLEPLIGTTWHYVILGVELIGILVMNSINTAVVINYATQCEMLIYYISAIDRKLREKTADLRVLMQDVLRVKQAISRLNGPTARMTSLCVINFSELTVIGLCLLILNKFTEVLVWIYRGCFVVVWVAYLVFLLLQASRLNSTWDKFKQSGLEVRVFGYQTCTVEELDSFLLFMGSTKSNAKLFNIPVKPSYLLGILVLTTFTLLILIQTNVIVKANWFL